MMLINGAPADQIPATDRGFAYGDGVFRTLRAVSGEPLHWRKQFNKLADDCARLNIPCPAGTVLLSEARAVARADAQAVVRITVTRGSGERGYAPPVPTKALRVVASWPQPQPLAAGEGIAARLCDFRLGHQPSLAGIKHLNRLENVLARAEWTEPGIREGLMLDQDGFAVCGTMSNLFIVEGRKLCTPLLDRCGVAGLTRARVIALAEKVGTPCTVERLPLPRLLDADEIFFVNSVIGLWPVAQLQARAWTLGPMARDFSVALAAEDAALA